MAFQFLPFLTQLLVGVGLQVLGYLLMGKPKGPQPQEVKDLESPTAEAGRPIPVVFGEVDVKGINFLYYGEKQTVSYETSA